MKFVEALKRGWQAFRNQGDSIPMSEGIYGSQLYEWFSGQPSAAGQVINERTAMCVSAVYACVGLISGALVQMPLKFYRNDPTGNPQEIKSDYYWLLNEQPFPMWSGTSFWEYLVWSRLLYGDAFARIIRPSSLSPLISGFKPYHPQNVTVLHEGDRMKYIFYDFEEARFIPLDQDDVLHFPGLGYNGWRSLSPIQYAAKQAIGTALATDQYAGAFFQNSARPDFILTAPGKLSDDQIAQLRKVFMERHSGPLNHGLPAVLTGGLDAKPLTISADDAQLIQTRYFQIEDIARIYGVPPWMIGQTDKTTSWGSGVEQMSLAFIKYTLGRHLSDFQCEMNRKIFRTAANFCKFDYQELLRGDITALANYYKMAIGGSAGPGWMTINEIRRRENLPPIEGGDKLIEWSMADVPTEQPAQQAA